MNKLPEWLIKLVIVALLPLVMCFGYYSSIALESTAWMILAVVALPLMLLGLGGLVWSHSKNGLKRLTPLWWACVVIAVMSLIWVWG
ncbi:hypothetical protein EH243_03140 [Amphritea opalescens]|uniref:Uncharacterized protein n=1 Tax=Amphritea opalescens TaxID=2490544 RepID=A0A430KV49_9GAMM|nr:hypothetical protein [Amphritea opalescens]RTE67214.1 hypothetical protein EH243_03140 [Amphritea opalescens]